MATWNNSATTDTVAGAVSGKNVKVVLSDPVEHYAASSAEVKELTAPKGKMGKISFSSAKVDGRECNDVDAFLRAAKKN